MSSITFNNIRKVYPNGVVAVNDFNLEIADREFVVLVGPSGCGKSTTLRMIAGLEDITSGELYLGDKLINNVAPKNRDISMVFQNYALYPHLTVFDNMAFGLKLRKVPRKIIRKKVEEVASILDLGGLLQRKPKALSGGQRQRVALGRAIVRDPAAFLLDEPLSNLDAKLRTQMRSEIKKLHYSLGATFVYVTHDQTEAMTMGDRLVVMKDGFIQQVDTPQNLYDRPCNLFVAGFIGSPQMNTFEASLERSDGGLTAKFDGGALPIPDSRLSSGSLDSYIGKSVILGIRPEGFHAESDQASLTSSCLIDARVELSEQMGSGVYLYVMCGTTQLIATLPTRSAARHGESVRLAVDCENLYIFDKDSEEIIN
jgi:multiple sugar transport system ATP-binding protein